MQLGLGVGIGFGSKAPVTFLDTFNRADAAIGNGWTVGAGTWATSGNKAVSTTDVTNDHAYRGAIPTTSFTVSADVAGTFAGPTDYRYPTILLHYINSTNYLFARIADSFAGLVKTQAGSNTTLQSGALGFTAVNGTTYNLKVVARNGTFQIYVNNVLKLTHTLVAGDRTIYLPSTSTKNGMRLHKTNAGGASAASFDNYTMQY